MATATAASGPGYTQASFPSGDGGAGGKKKKKGGGGGLGLSGLSSFLDPNLIRQAMLQGLEQRQQGFAQWLQNQEQNRWLAEEANSRAGQESTRAEDLFRNVNVSPRMAAGAMLAPGTSSLR